MLSCRLIVHWQVRRRERKVAEIKAKLGQAKAVANAADSSNTAESSGNNKSALLNDEYVHREFATLGSNMQGALFEKLKKNNWSHVGGWDDRRKQIAIIDGTVLCRTIHSYLSAPIASLPTHTPITPKYSLASCISKPDYRWYYILTILILFTIFLSVFALVTLFVKKRTNFPIYNLNVRFAITVAL